MIRRSQSFLMAGLVAASLYAPTSARANTALIAAAGYAATHPECVSLAYGRLTNSCDPAAGGDMRWIIPVPAEMFTLTTHSGDFVGSGNGVGPFFTSAQCQLFSVNTADSVVTGGWTATTTSSTPQLLALDAINPAFGAYAIRCVLGGGSRVSLVSFE